MKKGEVQERLKENQLESAGEEDTRRGNVLAFPRRERRRPRSFVYGKKSIGSEEVGLRTEYLLERHGVHRLKEKSTTNRERGIEEEGTKCKEILHRRAE